MAATMQVRHDIPLLYRFKESDMGESWYAYLVTTKTRQRVMLAPTLEGARQQSQCWGSEFEDARIEPIAYGMRGCGGNWHTDSGCDLPSRGECSPEQASKIASEIDKRMEALHKRNNTRYVQPGLTHLRLVVKMVLNKATVGDLADLEKWFPGPPSELKLNEEYTAKIEGDEIVVGCQRFPVSKLEELLELARND